MRRDPLIRHGGGAENPRLASGDPHSLDGLAPVSRVAYGQATGLSA
jgi:hypothetical protein